MMTAGLFQRPSRTSVAYASRRVNAVAGSWVPAASTRNADSPLQKLTDREFEVFQFIGRGKTTNEIAQELHISPRTVDVHRSQIKEKLHLKSGAALVHYAVQWFGKEG